MWQLNDKNNRDIHYPLDRSRIDIGRDESNDIVLQHEDVSGFHASLFMNAEVVELADVGSSNGTRVNGKEISGRVMLSQDDEIQLGSVSLILSKQGRRLVTAKQPAVQVQPPEQPEQPHKDPVEANDERPLVATLTGPGTGFFPQKLDIRGRVEVGRGTGCQLQLDDNMVSASHAVFEVDGEQVSLTDLGSTNGTFVNGVKVHGRHPLHHGDVIAFDSIEYRIEYPHSDNLAKTTVRPAISDDDIAKTMVRPAVAEPEPVVSSVVSLPTPDPVALHSDSSATLAASSPVSEPQGVYKMPWKNLLFSFEGRINRMQYFQGLLLLIVIAFVFALIISNSVQISPMGVVKGNLSAGEIDEVLFYYELLPFLFNTFVLGWPILALNSKRLHDLGVTGKWSIISLLPLLNSFIWLFLQFKSGDPNNNEYGPVPVTNQ